MIARYLPKVAVSAVLGVALFTATAASAQSTKAEPADTAKVNQLKEVVVISVASPSAKTVKPLATLDQYLEGSTSVNMIRRGSYAWEPYLNGMASERSVITVDGMRIYAACTDKMDPVTSYVEISNLSRADIHNGPSGANGGGAIAGNLNLVRRKSTFGETEWSGNVFSGFESNNRQKIGGGRMSYSSPKFFSDVDLTYRNADNYRAGGGRIIPYSQFSKFNLSAQTGYKVSEHQQIEASVIYDKATNVGYPALTMDVASAKAFIGSIEYSQHHISRVIQQWKTKVYYNSITHLMDDSKRPDVPIRMDMPGWSKTAGFYSMVEGIAGIHNWKVNVSGHHNRSLAEMTMFSNTPGEKDMFMLTWPDVHTNYGDLFVEDSFEVSKNLTLTLNGGLAVHNNEIKSLTGLESLRIFYPGADAARTRLLKRAMATLRYGTSHWTYQAGVGYGERAPSVSEGYGFYLFNSFDRFDYIGNPGMSNEKSVSFNSSVNYTHTNFTAKVSASWFAITDYIIGRPANGLSVMTIGAAGVKVYEQIKQAHLFNAALETDYKFAAKWQWKNRLSYRRGSGENIKNLPLIQPFTYMSGVYFSGKLFTAEANISGATTQNKFNPEFGEKELPAYAILNAAASHKVNIGDNIINIRAGVENILDKTYTTFADWNRIPRMGRNLFVNVTYSF